MKGLGLVPTSNKLSSPSVIFIHSCSSVSLYLHCLLCLFLQALCINAQCSDVLETLSLIFCGADVNCATGVAGCPSPLSLANAHSQPLQAELINHNLNTGTVSVHTLGTWQRSMVKTDEIQTSNSRWYGTHIIRVRFFVVSLMGYIISSDLLLD